MNSLRSIFRPLLLSIRQARFTRALAGVRLARDHEPRVLYLTRQFPQGAARRTEVVKGGGAKLIYLAEAFANQARCANIVYFVNGQFPWAALTGLRHLKRRGFRVVLNQNGVNTPFAYNYRHRVDYDAANGGYRELQEMADHVIFQSEFCRRLSERFLGPRAGASSVALNAVDTDSFRPPVRDRSEPGYVWRLFAIAAEEHRRDRLRVALSTLREIKSRRLPAQLWIAGYDPKLHRHQRVMEWIRTEAGDAGLTPEEVNLELGPFTREQAPSVLAAGDVLLHPAYMDPCPSLVTEALACGLPVAYARSGGVPELVGPEAGISVDVPEDWMDSHLPDASQLAGAVETLVHDYPRRSQAARRRAVDALSLENFIAHHRQVFEEVLRDQHDPRDFQAPVARAI